MINQTKVIQYNKGQTNKYKELKPKKRTKIRQTTKDSYKQGKGPTSNKDKENKKETVKN